MATLDNVPRRSSHDVEAFVAEHLAPCKPVVLTDLFDGQPLRELATLEAFASRLGDMVLGVSGNFAAELLRGLVPARREMSLRAYLAHVASEPGTRDYCYLEQPPRELADLYTTPAICDRLSRDDTVSLVFLGNAGNYSHLHYDEDLRDVLMFQLFGRKRYVMMDPTAAHKLDPLVLPGVVRTSNVCLQHMREAEQLDFLRYAGAWDVVLEPGETLLMPRAFWHYVEYVDTSLSVNFRMGRSESRKALSRLMPQPNIFMQALARLYFDDATISPLARDVLAKLLSVGATPSDDDVHAAVLEAYDALVAKIEDRPHTLSFSQLRAAVLPQPR